MLYLLFGSFLAGIISPGSFFLVYCNGEKRVKWLQEMSGTKKESENIFQSFHLNCFVVL